MLLKRETHGITITDILEIQIQIFGCNGGNGLYGWIKQPLANKLIGELSYEPLCL